MPRNILAQIIAGSHPGGAGKLFQEFAIELARIGVKQLIITRPYKERVEALRHRNIMLRTVPMGSPYLDFYSRLKIRLLLKQAKPKVVISWLQRAATFTPRSDNYTHIGRLDGYYSAKYYKSADRFVAVSPPIGEHLSAQDKLITDKLQVIPNSTMPAKNLGAERKPNGRVTIVTLSRFHRVKGYDLLIKAAVDLKGVDLLLVGEGPEERNLRDLVNSLGIGKRVRFLPWQQDINTVLASADMLAMPSRKEAFGLPLIDAWAHKKAVIASKCAGPISYIRHGQNGMLCEVGDVSTLRESIATLKEDEKLRRKLATNGYKEWKSKFSPQVMVKRWLEILKDEGL